MMFPNDITDFFPRKEKAKGAQLRDTQDPNVLVVAVEFIFFPLNVSPN